MSVSAEYKTPIHLDLDVPSQSSGFYSIQSFNKCNVIFDES